MDQQNNLDGGTGGKIRIATGATLCTAGLCWLVVQIVWDVPRLWREGTEKASSDQPKQETLPQSGFIQFFVQSAMSNDHFADDLKLPEHIALAEPQEGVGFGFDPVPGNADDTFQAAIRKASKQSGIVPVDARFQFSALSLLRKEHAGLLARYLAAHPGWRVYEEHQKQFSLRRWMNGNQWLMDLGGYYSSSDNESGPSFGSRTIICFSGESWSPGAQRISSEPLSSIHVISEHDYWKSHVMVPADTLLIEQVEQSSDKERKLTYAAFTELEKEFATLLAIPTWTAAQSLLPKGSILRGHPSITLTNSIQGGIYNVLIRCNPGAPGRIYLKAFEVTRGTELSKGRLQRATNEWIGWSYDPMEQFMSETHFTIYEGEWNQFYGARFEVWFKPDDGGAERKLLERIFKIQGWTR